MGVRILTPPKPDRVKTLTAEKWAELPLSERWLHVARSYVGERESAPNDSKLIRAWLRLCGVLVPSAWCGAFVTACLVEAGADRKKLPKFAASTYYWYVWAKLNKRLLTFPKRGYVFLWNGANGGHMGAVIRTEEAGPYIETLEGNTNDEGAREGYEVCERERLKGDIKKHPRWGYVLIDGGLE